MSIAIVLRTDGKRNVFRDTIISTLQSGHIDDALLCSGFFQDNFKGSAYKASSEEALSNVCVSSGVTLTTIGIHNSTWKPAYVNFRDNMKAAGANVRCLYKSGMRWHAKVFIGRKNGVPNIGIVGSSNMTRNAFSTGSKFNNECDVFMWDRKSQISAVAAEMADRLGEQIVVRAPYVPRMNGGRSLPEMLAAIYSEVLKGDMKDL